MDKATNSPIDTITQIIGLLSDNLLYILIFIILLIFRKPLIDLMKRLTNFNYKQGSAEISVEAAAPQLEHEAIASTAGAVEPVLDAKEEVERISSKAEGVEKGLYAEILAALEDGNVDNAKAAFEKYESEEEDPIELQRRKAVFLYLLFDKEKDNAYIDQLKELANESIDEESKYRTLSWLSFCYDDIAQYDTSINLWRSSIEQFELSLYITSSIVSLAKALNRNEGSIEARSLLIDRLNLNLENKEKSKLFGALSLVEKSLGHDRLAVYCRDKSLEFDPGNREELFNTAYLASEEDVKALSLSNYATLLRMDSNNSLALNNLGAQAQEAELLIEAAEYYRKSSELNETLAMANKGYLLLDAGFAEEAEKIAREAVVMEDPHQNVYSLLGRISELREEQSSKWKELIATANTHQKHIRSYVTAYYKDTQNAFEGEWNAPNGSIVNIQVLNSELDARWQETGASTVYNCSLKGAVTNSSFQGRYKKTKEGEQPAMSLLSLSLNMEVGCFGVMSSDGMEISLFPEDTKKEFSMVLKRKDPQ